MSWFPKPSSPGAALRDLRAFMRQRSREQLIGGGLALALTALILFAFSIDTRDAEKPPPQITMVDIYPENRTDADIIADQKKDQAAYEAAKKEKMRQFQKLQKQLGIE